jgi:chromosome segregation ATPase
VVLYPDVAEVTRLVDVDAPTDTVVLSGLSPDLLPESISAKTLSGNARIAGISSEDIFRTEAASERVKELERKLEELSEGRRSAEEGISGGRKEKELLERGVRAVFSPAEEAGTKEMVRQRRLTTAEIEASLSLFRTRAQAIDERILEREREVRDFDRKIAAVRQELDKIRPCGRGRRR